jgi:hypothetical protein
MFFTAEIAETAERSRTAATPFANQVSFLEFAKKVKN